MGRTLRTLATAATGVLLATLLVVAAPLSVRPASAQASCSAGSAAALVACIDAYNNEPDAVTHTVTLTADITQSITIDNVTDATLELNGAGHTLTFSSGLDVVLLAAGDLQLSNITLTGGAFSGVYLSTGDATISDSTITGNTIGIEIDAGFSGSVEVINTTLVGNDSGVLLAPGRSITVRQSTIVDNDDLGIRHFTNSTAVLIGSLIAGNTNGSCNGGIHTGSSNNVIDDTSCTGLAQTPGVAGTYAAGLADNGCSAPCTDTIALMAGSPAIDAAGDCAPVTSDQRGLARTPGKCDTGAFELGDCNAASDVADEDQLALVIGCYNMAGAGETVTANLTGDIQLTDALMWIRNTVEPNRPLMVINGNGRTITGEHSTVVIRVDAGDFTLNDAEITGSGSASSGVHVSGSSIARINGSTLHGNGAGVTASGSSVLAVTNSTLTDNIRGAAMYESGELQFNLSTIAFNSGAGIQDFSGAGTGKLTLDGSIVEGNGGAQCVDVVNPTTSDTNVIEDTSCGNSTAQFSPITLNLSHNGCSMPCTRTLLIFHGSVAVDRAGACDIAVDQRGVSRTAGKCDAGAYEVADCFQETTVGTVDELRSALLCHKGSPADTTNTINLSAHIDLAGQTAEVESASTVTLRLDGKGFALDGGGITGIGVKHISGALELTDLTIRNTSTAVLVDHFGSTKLDGVTVSGNEAGVWAQGSSEVNVENSTITGNTSIGVYAASLGAVRIVNSTVHDNGDFGVLVDATTADRTLVIRQSTITNNGGFGIEHRAPSSFTVTSVLADSIVADNITADCDQAVTTNAGDNIIGDPTCTGNATNGVGATLGALADNGGPTHTRALLPGSPAIDAANTCQIPTDQRGVPRPTGKCDAGAFELVELVAATCNGLEVTVDLNLGQTPTETADVILGTPGDDTINSLGGDDTICAGAGADTIDAGAGDDTAFGEDGNDTLVGGDGDDTMHGGAGRDIIRGNPGADTINGDGGNDRLLGGIDDDTINGGDGDDYIGGFGGSDTINGGPGKETIFGGFGADIIDGGDGDDSIFGLIGNDKITGGAGKDLLNGDRGNDTINGGVGDDNINGGNANDILNGNGGDDVISGGRADDTLRGGAGADTCIGNKHIIADTADATCEITFGIP